MKKILLLSLFLLSIASPFAMLHAQTGSQGVDYKLLEPLPLSNPSGRPDLTTNTKQYIEGFIKLLIAVAGGLAVLRIIIGGVQYMTTEAFSGKSEAKETILNAIIGFLLAAGSFLIVTTVNPDLATFNLSLQNVGSTKPLDTDLASTSEPVTTGTLACTDCSEVPSSIPHKTAAEKGCAVDPCTLNKDFISQLETLTSKLSGKVTWQLTEMYPPTVTHIDSCHSQGTCADGKLFAVTTGRLLAFLTEVESVFGQNYEYEVCDKKRLSELQNDPQLARFRNKFKCESTTVGAESIHIEMTYTWGKQS